MTSTHHLPAVIVGAGLMGHWHAAAAARAGAQIIGVVDPDVARARALARRFPGALATSTLAPAGHDSPSARPCVVHVCTPTATHAAVTRDALERGCHALVEKPLAEDATTTGELLRLAAAAGVLLCPTHQFIYQRGVQQVLSAHERLGDILHVRALACSAGAADRPDMADVVALEILPHPLSLLERLSPGVLDRIRWTMTRPGRGELALLSDGAPFTAGITISMHGRPTMNELTVVGTRGSAHIDMFHGFAVFERGDVSQWQKIRRPFVRSSGTLASAGSNLIRRAVTRQAAYPGLWELVAAFYGAVRSGAAPPITPEEALRVARECDVIRSALSFSDT